MIFDAQAIFDQDVALTATRNSTNVMDLLRAGEDIGGGEPLYLVFIVTTILDSAGEAATLQIALVTDDNASLSSPATIMDQPALITEATLVTGYMIAQHVKPFAAMERYLGVVYTVGTENFTSGKIWCGLTHDLQRAKAYASGITVTN